VEGRNLINATVAKEVGFSSGCHRRDCPNALQTVLRGVPAFQSRLNVCDAQVAQSAEQRPVFLFLKRRAGGCDAGWLAHAARRLPAGASASQRPALASNCWFRWVRGDDWPVDFPRLSP
jgi:hypothetical protein